MDAERTSIIYEGIDSNKELVVVKIAKKNEYLFCFKQERDALTRLSELNSPHIPKLLLSNINTLIITPFCMKVKNLDLQKYNFLRDNNGNILIADRRYSVIEGDNMPFAGVLECMPDDILESLDNNKAINYNPRMDFICLVRSLYLMFHNPVMERFSFDKVLENRNFKKQLQEIKTFWFSHGNSSE
ncbi:hypothetical protein RhiirA5_405680 [Rhizophagus irregularis]|uniref:Uncharacterized protein n=1 Tax=Rhizophagus irregularis TaxID=588596 RepID=A0A2I1EBR2_9GLOM|nr:hypothetical protein RhiirA5_405680 [Rhizophagus irregularis]PKY19569.1 hypothetical protein RhiirB3_432651 [Rhizophagus irregularis]